MFQITFVIFAFLVPVIDVIILLVLLIVFLTVILVIIFIVVLVPVAAGPNTPSQSLAALATTRLLLLIGELLPVVVRFDVGTEITVFAPGPALAYRVLIMASSTSTAASCPGTACALSGFLSLKPIVPLVALFALI